MLSKVLKGTGAEHVPQLTFPQVTGPTLQQAVTSTESWGAGQNQSILLERIRVLEGGLATAKREAFEAGQQQARAALTPVIERLNASVAELMNMRPELRRRAERDAVELALLIAKRVLHRELSIDVNALNALARVVFERLARAESWQLRVNPQFADAVRGALPAGSVSRVQIEVDPSCDPGTLVARCGDGTVDASIDTQLEEIGRGLTDRLAPR